MAWQAPAEFLFATVLLLLGWPNFHMQISDLSRGWPSSLFGGLFRTARKSDERKMRLRRLPIDAGQSSCGP